MFTNALLTATLLASTALSAPSSVLQPRQDNNALANNQDLISALTLAATAEDRLNLLKAFNSKSLERTCASDLRPVSSSLPVELNYGIPSGWNG